MLKVLLITACVVLLNGCLPPNPYMRSTHADYPPGYIAIAPGQSVEGAAAEEVPGSADIIGVSSELNGELLTATFHLRELPEEAEYSHEPGHFRLESNHWLVLVSIEGDPLTPMSHLDYMFKVIYYDPKKPEMVVVRPAEPMVTGALYKGRRAIREHNGIEYEYTALEFLSSDVEVTFSHEEGTITLAAEIPGITSQSTIAFVSHGMFSGSPDYLPRDAD